MIWFAIAYLFFGWLTLEAYARGTRKAKLPVQGLAMVLCVLIWPIFLTILALLWALRSMR